MDGVEPFDQRQFRRKLDGLACGIFELRLAGDLPGHFFEQRLALEVCSRACTQEYSDNRVRVSLR